MPERDAEAFRELYHRYHAAVCRFLAARASAAQVEDLAAETFLIAWRRAGSVPDMQLPWLLHVARNCLANDRRTVQRAGALVDHLGHVACFDAPGADGDLERREQQRAVLEGLAGLSALDRELLLLHLWDDLRPREIAVVLDLSAIVVRARLSRALRRLQKTVGEQLADPSPPVHIESLTAGRAL